MIGKTGAILVVLVLFALCGSVLTAFVGAPAAVIPFFDFLVGLPLLPLPTGLLYLFAIIVIYLLLTTAIARGGTPSWRLQTGALFVALAAVGSAGWLVPQHWNRAAGVEKDSIADSRWKALGAEHHDRIALVSEGWDSAVCNAFCLSLLVTGRAGEVLIAHLKRKPAPTTTIDGQIIRLPPNWRACFSRLPDYLFESRSDPHGRLDMFKSLGLDPYFEPVVARCLDVRQINFNLTSQVTLVNWHDNPTGEPGPESVGLGQPIGEQRILLPNSADNRVRLLRFGRRYGIPAFLWPYAGNAGSGGRFELSWSTTRFSTIPDDEHPPSGWWGMMADGDSLARLAVGTLDRTVSSRKAQQPSSIQANTNTATE